MKTKKFLALAAALCLAAGYATTIVDLADGATVSALDFNGYNGHTGSSSSDVSVADYALRFSKDVTITLDASAASDGVFTLYANIYATSGGFTVDATGIDVIRWVGGVQTAGKVTVRGAKEIRFGERVRISSPNTRTNFSYFNTDVEFENGEATGLVFTNAVTCAKLPTSCDWSISAGMRLAVDADGLLGGGAPTFTLSGYDITLIATKGIAAGEIIVPAGRTLEVRQCSRTTFHKTDPYIGRWTWGGQNNNHVTNNITFEAGSVFYVDGGQGDLYFDGDLAGETAFTAALNNSNPMHFTSTAQLSGTLTFQYLTAFDLSGEGPFSFGTVTSAAQHDITGLEGRVLSISGLAANSVIGVGSGIDFRLGSVGKGAQVNLLGAGPWTVQGPASGEALNLDGVLAPAATGAITLGGLLKLGDLGTTFSSVTLLEGAVLTGTTFDPSVTISGAGRVMCGGKPWREKVALWTDASAADSFMTVREFSPSVDQDAIAANKIVWWYDCRNTATSSNTVAFAMCRYATTSASDIAKYPNMYPHIVSGQLNGKTILKCSNNTQTRMGLISASARISNNYSTWTPVNTVHAMVVARNVQSTHGASLLTTSDGSLAASKTGYDANIFTNESLTVYRDGALVDQTATTWGNSVWGVYSFTAGGAPVIGLTSRTNPGASNDGNGGFDYAEILLFTEAPTEAERKLAEEYLAAKWGLPCAHSDTREEVSLTLGVSGATASAVVECSADDVPRAFTVNLDFGSGTVRGARYPILKCPAGDTYELGTVTGARRASSVALEYDSETGTLYAAIRATGFRLIIQ